MGRGRGARECRKPDQKFRIQRWGIEKMRYLPLQII
jgi:hypothetical protein